MDAPSKESLRYPDLYPHLLEEQPLEEPNHSPLHNQPVEQQQENEVIFPARSLYHPYVLPGSCAFVDDIQNGAKSIKELKEDLYPSPGSKRKRFAFFERYQSGIQTSVELLIELLRFGTHVKGSNVNINITEHKTTTYHNVTHSKNSCAETSPLEGNKAELVRLERSLSEALKELKKNSPKKRSIEEKVKELEEQISIQKKQIKKLEEEQKSRTSEEFFRKILGPLVLGTGLWVAVFGGREIGSLLLWYVWKKAAGGEDTPTMGVLGGGLGILIGLGGAVAERVRYSRDRKKISEDLRVASEMSENILATELAFGFCPSPPPFNPNC